MLAQRLFDVLKERILKRNDNRVAVVELDTLKNKESFFSLINHLKAQKYITVETSINLIVIHLTEQGALRLKRYDHW